MIGFASGRQMNPAHLPLWVPTRRNRAYRAARTRVHTYIQDVIAQRRAQPPETSPPDLLTRLMQAWDAETGEPMADSLLRDEAITIFFAGHETTRAPWRSSGTRWLSIPRWPPGCTPNWIRC